MVILWLLASTAKNQIREIMIDQLVAIEAQTIEIVSHYQKVHAAELDGEQIKSAFQAVSKSNMSILGMGMLKKEGSGSLDLLSQYSKARGEGMVDFDTYFKLLKSYGLQPPVSLHCEYPLGGAEKGKYEISIDKK